MKVPYLMSDEITIGKILEILLLIGVLLILIFYAFNIPELSASAMIYWILGLTGLCILFGDLTLKKIGKGKGVVEIINVISHERETFFGELSSGTKKLLIVGLIVLGLVTFFWMSRTGYSLVTPGFQIIALGPVGASFLDGLAGIMEDIIFFGVLGGIFFGAGYYFTKNVYLSILIAVIFVPALFLGYHHLRYGPADVLASTSTYLFAVECTLATCLLGSLSYAHVRHFSNNFGKAIFTKMSFGTFMTQMFASPIFWIIILVIIGILVWMFMRKRKPSGGMV